MKKSIIIAMLAVSLVAGHTLPSNAAPSASVVELLQERTKKKHKRKKPVQNYNHTKPAKGTKASHWKRKHRH